MTRADVTTGYMKQLWREALGELGKSLRNESDCIAAVMDNMPGWRKGPRLTSGIYRGYLTWVKES